jgi:hypothetical protein
MKKLLTGLALLGAAVGAALSAEAAALAGTPAAGAVQAIAVQASTVQVSAVSAGPVSASAVQASTRAAAPPPHPVVLVGIPGLRWTDVSPAGTPALWRLARQGSVGSLVVHTIMSRTCPADGWLTLNAGARATVPHQGTGPCPQPRVTSARPAAPGPVRGLGRPVPADVPSMPSLIRYNRQFHYSPDWGLLSSAAGTGRCATAIGPGAALALAGPAGQVASYLPSAAAASRSSFTRCPLTAVSLGAIPAPAGSGAAAVRAAAVSADDQALGRIVADLPAGAITAVFAPGDDGAPHLRLIVVEGPGYAAGLLDSASTREPGLSQLTDLTPSVLGWRGQPVPAGTVGSPVYRADRGSLAAEIRALVGQDTAAQVYRGTWGWFFAVFVVIELAVFGAIAVLFRGQGEDRRRRRWAAARVAGVVAGSVPAGTFLASLVPWWLLPHPAVLLYLLAAAWAIVIAGVALAGPWRRDPMGPPGLVAAVTLVTIGLDVMTGSRLELSTPFGLAVLLGGRFYGEDNNTIGIYGAAGILCAAWLAAMALRSAVRPSPGASRAAAASQPASQRGRAVLVVSAVALFAVIASGWPGFGAKVGGTIAMVPGFVLLIMAVADIRLSARRAVLVILSGVGLFAAFALVNYFVPVTGHSDIGAFAGQALHGGAGGTLQRKIGTNLASLTTTPYNLLIPVIVAGLGLLLLRPGRFGAGALTRAWQTVPLLKVSLATIWLMAVLGWFAEDSGVGVPGATLPFILPLAIAVVAGAASRDDEAAAGSQASANGTATGQGGPGGFRGDLVPGAAAGPAGPGADDGQDA